MKYRGFEYTIIQGYQRGTWRWSVTLRDGQTKSGSISGKREALTRVERAINNEIEPRKQRLRPSRRDPG